MANRLQFEFPPETSELIVQLGSKLHLSPAEVLTKGIGLLDLLVKAHEDGRIVVERPKSGISGQEFEVDINP